jgi:hypothetical protein
MADIISPGLPPYESLKLMKTEGGFYKRRVT